MGPSREVELVTLQEEGHGMVQTYTVHCTHVSGDHPSIKVLTYSGMHSVITPLRAVTVTVP